MDAFYASIEQRDAPELRGRPVIVGGVGTRGVVSAASYEARRYGVHSAMPTAQARQRCPEGVYLRGDMGKYVRESKRIFAVFRRFSPSVEGISLDEAFLDLSGTERLQGPPVEVGHALRAALREETGLAASVGIAPVKMVAKIASDLAKPDGLLEVSRDGLREFLDPLPVGRIWGVGPVAQARLGRAGIGSIGQLVAAPAEQVLGLLGDFGQHLVRLALGQDFREVEPFRDARSISEENTFPGDVAERATLEAALWTHAESVARRLRKSGLVARTVVLKLKRARRVRAGPRGYPLLTRRTTLAEPTDDGARIAREALGLLARVELEPALRLLGVGAANLSPANLRQLSWLPEARERVRQGQLNRSLDVLRERFGPGAVRRAAQGAAPRAGLSEQRKRGEE